MELTRILPAARRRVDTGRAVILRYHSVSHFDSSGRLYRSPSIAVTPETFERQMRFLADWYQVVPLNTLVDCLLHDKAFPQHAVAVTFDDGYRDNFMCAFPVLRSLGLPATVYVTTGAIGNGWRFWLARVRACILATSKTGIDLDGLGRFDLSSERARENAVEHLVKRLKLFTNEERESSIERLVSETGHRVPLTDSDNWFMTWGELKDMSAAGIDIGSHTRSHPILTRLSDESAATEIRRSREELESALGRAVHHFAYPNGGGVLNHDARIVNLVRNAGFRSAATSVNGVVRRGADPFRISRIGIAQRHGLDGLALNLERDRLFAIGRPGPLPGLLLVGPPPEQPGGMSTCVRTVLNSEIRSRFAICHLCPTGGYGYHQPKILALARLLWALARFPMLILSRRPAIVQVHTAYGNDFWRSAPFVLFSSVARVPSVLIIHGSQFDRAYQEATAPERAAIRFVLRRVSAIHVRGEYWRRFLHAMDPGLPVYLLPTTTDITEEAAVDPALKWMTPIVLFVGGHPAVKDNVRKGLPELLAIVSRLAAEVPQVRVRIVGPKPGDPWRSFLAPESTERVEFMGSLSREEIGNLYRTAAVFVLPSHAEGMPNSVLEAMAGGLPIVATLVGSISEVVEEGVGGYLVPPGDQEQLAAALIKLLKDPKAATRMGEHNRAVVKARFTNQHTTNRLLGIYDTLMSRDQT
jgi:glycosyltransferase involved in cell wall biosynthesis